MTMTIAAPQFTRWSAVFGGALIGTHAALSLRERALLHGRGLCHRLRDEAPAVIGSLQAARFIAAMLAGMALHKRWLQPR